jgi:hypothetical protein
MTRPDSADYFHRRALEERAAAELAHDERAANSHRELARRYDEKAEDGPGAEAEEPEFGSVLPDEFQILP